MSAFVIGSMVIHGFIYAAVLVIVWMGWMRHRRAGFLVLTLWAMTALISLGATPVIHAFLSNAFPAGSSPALFLLPEYLLRLLSSALLVTGLAMLVFGRQPATSREE